MTARERRKRAPRRPKFWDRWSAERYLLKVIAQTPEFGRLVADLVSREWVKGSRPFAPGDVLRLKGSPPDRNDARLVDLDDLDGRWARAGGVRAGGRWDGRLELARAADARVELSREGVEEWRTRSRSSS